MSDLHAYLREYIEKLETLLEQCDTGNDSCLLQAACRLWGEDDPRYLVLAASQGALKRGIDPAPKPPEESDFEQADKAAKGQIHVNKPVNRQ